MNNSIFFGILDEERVLCWNCADRLYGSSLEVFLAARVVWRFSESDRPTYASKGLLCDDCSSWIFPPDRTAESWWLVDPDPEEYLRLLAPFADFLETLQIDAVNLRNIALSKKP